MSRLIVIIAVVILPQIVLTQFNEEAGKMSRVKPGLMWHFTGLRPATAGKAQKYDRLIFDILYNDWQGDLTSFKNKWYSIGLNTNILFDIGLNKRNSLSLGTGFRHSLFRTENLGNLFSADPTNTYTMVSEGVSSDCKRRLLCGNSIGIPLELRFRTKGIKHVKFHMGGVVAYQWNIYARSVFTGQEGRQVVKDYNFKDVNPLALSAHIRVGIRNWAVYGSYGINPLFSNRSSTYLHLIQLGISVSLF
jgi:hypothetical protein